MQLEDTLQKYPFASTLQEVTEQSIIQNPQRRTELVQILLQELENLGYEDTLRILETESNIQLHNSPIVQLKDIIQSGDLNQAIQAIENQDLPPHQKRLCLFNLYQQIYIDFILNKQISEAVQILRNQLFTFHQDTQYLYTLSTLLLCHDFSSIQKILQLPGTQQNQRKILYQSLLTIVEYHNQPKKINYFDHLLEQAHSFQILNCPHHNQKPSLQQSLLKDHRCDFQQPPDQCVTHFQHFDDEVWILSFNNAQNQLAAATRSKTIYFIDLNTLQPIKMLKDAHKKDINSLNWNMSDTRLISSGSDYIVNIYCTKQCELLLKINLHKSPVMTAVYHPKSNNIYSAGIDNWVGIWNENGQFIDYFETKMVKNILFSSDGQFMIIHYTSQNYLNVYEATKKPNKLFTLEEQDKITSSALSQDNSHLLLNVSQKAPQLHLWSLQSRQLIHIFSGFQQTQFQLQCSFVGNEEYFVAVGSENGKVSLYHKTNPKYQYLIACHESTVNCIAWSNKNQWLATSSDDRSIKLWRNVKQEGN